MIRRYAILLLVSMGLAGCMTGKNYERPETALPEQWCAECEGGAVGGTAPLTAWWTTLNDPLLNSLIARAVETSLDLRAAEARVREARAARGIAGSSLWPTLGASASWTYSQSVAPERAPGGPPVSFGASAGAGGLSRSVTVAGRNGALTRTVSGAGATNSLSVSPPADTDVDRTGNTFQAGFDARWELDIFGGNRRAVEAADAEVSASEERRRGVLLSLLSEVALNYIELRTAQRRMETTQKNIDAQRTTLTLTQARFDAGISSELDAVRAQSLLSGTESQLPFLETQIAMSIHRLGVLLGDVPGSLMAELLPQTPLPVAPDQIPVGMPSDLLRRRPDIRAAERTLAAASARVGQAQADLFPKFYLTSAFAGQSANLGNVLSGANQLWSIGPSVNWPIFQGGRIRANIEVQDARHEQALLDYEQSILVALEEVENGMVSFAKEQVRRASIEQQVAANEAAVRLANERYIRGLEGFLNVAAAQQELFQSEDQLVQSQSFVLTSLIALYKALGGGWEAHEIKPADALQAAEAATAAP
jgi:NodT family efflux transporter outer membrane factor (OMF) lipoprotein